MEPFAFRTLLLLTFMAAGVTFVITGSASAPYGRHTRPGWGPGIPVRLGWIAMESPTIVVFVVAFATAPRAGELVPRVMATLWLVHAVHRGLVHPLRMRPGQRTMPSFVVAFGFAVHAVLAYLNGRSLGVFGPHYSLGWLLGVRFLYGLLVFVTGFIVNRVSDRMLRALRRPGETGYAIPRGGLFDELSCPNYLGEVIQWIGWAVLTWSQAGLAVAVWSAANLIPRAVAHHDWYRRTFPDYPRNRHAILPFLL